MICKNCNKVHELTIETNFYKPGERSSYYFCCPHCVMFWFGQEFGDDDVSQHAQQRQAIHVPPIDPVKVAEDLRRRAASVERELRKLEEAKKVSPETWTKVIGEKQKQDILRTNICCPSHCCRECKTCKYGFDDCPVVLGISSGVECEECGFERERARAYYGSEDPRFKS